MTILELLQSEETPCHVQGLNTRIVRNWDDGTFEVFQVKNKGRKGSYTVELYAGDSETDAVTAFITGEKL